MLGHAVYGRGRMEKASVHEVPVCKVYLKKTGFLAAYLRSRQWKALRRQGVRFAIFPRELRAEAAQFGIRPFSVAPLRRALLGQLVGRGECARLSAGYADHDVETAAILLTRRYRYVSLDVSRGEDGLSTMLYRRFGVAQGACGAPEITVSFYDEIPAGHTICLGERCGDYQVLCCEVKDWAAENVPEEYLCALFLAGKLKKEDICVKTLRSTA